MLLMIAVALGGCAALPSHVERPGLVRSAATSPVRRWRASSPRRRPRQRATCPGFRLLPDGSQAFDARLALVRRAERTLDVQYYLIASDGTGLQFLRELQQAASRGVRVRVLVDDLYATGEDALFAGLAAQANVEVRMFNPLPVRSGSFAERVALSLHEFSRINRRMHNKLFIADGALAISGGRNIADAYFGRSEPANFIDMDILSTGPVVGQLAAVFDSYWNSAHAYPIQSLIGPGFDRAARAPRLRGEGRALADERCAGRTPIRSGQSSVESQLAEGRDRAHLCKRKSVLRSALQGRRAGRRRRFGRRRRQPGDARPDRLGAQRRAARLALLRAGRARPRGDARRRPRRT